jgi:hypothetical protein|tara:strand:+ start:1046 stop:1228 length:183 start_codon:yes stop_codon:yes gene_type:complete
MLTLEELRIIDYLKAEADSRSKKARSTENTHQRQVLYGEAIGIRQMVIDLLGDKHKDASE